MQPIAPVPLHVEVEPSSPRLLARISREPDAPRIVASGFLNDPSAIAVPILVLETGEVQLWDIARGLLDVRVPRRFAKASIAATCAAFFPTLTLVATGRESGQVQLHQLEPFSPSAVPRCRVTSLAAHRGRVLSLAFGGNRLWSAGSDGAVVSLDFASPCREQIVMDGVAWLRCLAVSPDGAHLALGGESGQLQMCRVSLEGAVAAREWMIGRGTSALETLAFSANGQMLLGTDTAKTTRLWAAKTGHELQLFAGQTPATPVLALDNRLLATPGAFNEIRLLDAWTGAARFAPLPFERVQNLAFSPLREEAERYTQLLIGGAGEIEMWKIGGH